MIIAIFLLLFSLGAQERVEEEVIYEAEPIECLQLMGVGPGGGISYQLNFFNACNEKINANVCVEEREDFYRLHRSASKIPEYGHLTIFTYEGVEPGSVSWTSSQGTPSVPEKCNR